MKIVCIAWGSLIREPGGPAPPLEFVPDSDDSAGLPAATPPAVVAGIADWMRTHEVDAAVWTALPAKCS